MSDIALREFTASKGQSGVTFEAGLIKGVKVLGRVSKNGHTYTDKALANVVDLIRTKGAVYVDHMDGERRMKERFGKLENARIAPDGVRADLRYLESHAVAAAVKEDFDKGLGLFGLSIDGRGKRVKKGNTHMVEEVSDLKSTDLVSEPATVSSLREQEEMVEAADPFVAAATALLHSATDKDELLTKLGELWDTLKEGGEGGTEEAPEEPAMTQESIKKLVADAVAEALKEQAKPKPNGKYVKPKVKAESSTTPVREQTVTVPDKVEDRINWMRGYDD